MRYSWQVDYQSPNVNYPSAAMGGSDDRQSTLSSLTYHVEYYRNLGYTVTSATITTDCEVCNGTGHKQYKRRNPLRIPVNCTQCKGNGYTDKQETLQ